MECMSDVALLEADCAAEDRFVFTFARRLLGRAPVGVEARQARQLAQCLLDEGFVQGVVPAGLDANTIQRCLSTLRMPPGLLGATCGVLRARRRAACPPAPLSFAVAA